MRTAAEWFERYGESHRDPVNKAIHWVCIPVILTTTLGLLQALPHPFGDQPHLHWGTIVALLALGFYARLSLTLALGMAVVSLGALVVNHLIVAVGLPLATSSALVFAVAWVLQFIGHKVEGKKPSFLEDLQFLLIGPAWLLQFVYAKVGIPVERSPRGS
ncbi:MAG: DUF962 domain-containing protein [Myxococcota bacterium]